MDRCDNRLRYQTMVLCVAGVGVDVVVVCCSQLVLLLLSWLLLLQCIGFATHFWIHSIGGRLDNVCFDE